MMAIFLDNNRYAPVRPDINARDRATAVDDALNGALNVSLREFGFRHDRHALLRIVSVALQSFFQPQRTYCLPKVGPGVLDQPRDARETLPAARSHWANQVAPHLTVRRRDAPEGIASRSPSKWRNDFGYGWPRYFAI